MGRPDSAASHGLEALAVARATNSARTHQKVLNLRVGVLRIIVDRDAVLGALDPEQSDAAPERAHGLGTPSALRQPHCRPARGGVAVP